MPTALLHRQLKGLCAIIFLCMFFAAAVAFAATAAPPGPETIVFDNRPLFTLHPVRSIYSAEERARIVEGRLRELVAADVETFFYRVEEDEEGQSRVVLNNRQILTVTDDEAAAENTVRAELAEKRAKILLSAVQQYQEERKPTNTAIRLTISVLATVTGIFLWKCSGKFARRRRVKLQRGYARGYKVQKSVLISPKHVRVIIRSINILLLLLFRLTVLYTYIYLMLATFPETRHYADQILKFLLSPLYDMGTLLLGYLPNFITITIIVLICKYLLAFMRIIFREIEKKDIVIPGFYHEWAAPTYTIIRALFIVLAFVAIFPYIPGSQSLIFQGMSVFLGLLISMASSSTLSNILAGYVLIYTRSFAEGDVIRYANHTGTVVQKELLATQIQTFKNEIVTVPNSLLLGESILNYSKQPGTSGLVLYTTITIGYDAPWRTVQELLKQAASRTKGVENTPEPFVLQTALNDFYISYQLNVYTNKPELMARIYSELHRNILDCFNEAGVEIMSPHYTAIRNGNQATIPEEYS